MKSKRLISLLLSAALALSSLPMMMATAVTAADTAIEVGENLLDGVEPAYTGASAEEITDAAAGGNRYLHVGNRQADRNNGINFYVGTVEAGTYYISFDARTSVDPVKVLKKDSEDTVIVSTTNMVYTDTPTNDPCFLRMKTTSAQNVLLNNTINWMPVASGCPNGYYQVNNNASGSSNGVKLDSTWRSYEIELEFTGESQMLDLQMFAAGSIKYRACFDIDNWSVYTKEVGEDGTETKKYLCTYTFEEPVDVYLGGKSTTLGFAKRSSTTYEVVTEEDYVEVTPDEDGDIVISYSLGEGLYLEPGEYNLSGEFRYAWHLTDTYNWELDYYFDSFVNVAATVIMENGDAYDATVKVGNDWSDVGVSVALPEGGTVTEIRFDTQKIDAIAILERDAANSNHPLTGNKYDGKAMPDAPIDVKNISFTLSKPFDEEYVTVDTSDYLDGAAVQYTGAFNHFGNDSYLYIPEREDDVFTPVSITISEQPVADRTYYWGMDVYSEYLSAAEGGYFVFRPVVDKKNGITTDENEFLTDSWLLATENNELKYTCTYSQFPYYYGAYECQYLEGYFTVAGVGEANSIKLNINRGPSGTYKNGIGIDNIKVWYIDDNGDKVYIYENDFNSGKLNTTGNEIAVDSKAPYEIASAFTKITPVDGETAGVTYDLTDVDQKTGTYTFSVDIASTGATGKVQLVVTDEEGSEYESAAIEVGSDYADLSYTVSVDYDNPVEIKSIAIVTDIADEILIKNENLTLKKDPVILGDANGSDTTNSIDLIYFQRYMANWEGYIGNPKRVNPDALDVNGDEDVNVTDAVVLARHIAKWKGYENLVDVNLGLSDETDMYVFVNGPKNSTPKKTASELGLPEGYGDREFYTYESSPGIVNLDTGYTNKTSDNIVTIYSEVMLAGMRIYSVDKNGVVNREDDILFPGLTLKDASEQKNHYGTNDAGESFSLHWRSANKLMTGFNTANRNYVKYGISDVTGDGIVNYTDYSKLYTATDKDAKIKAYAVTLTDLVKTIVSGTEDYTGIPEKQGNLTAVKAFIKPFLDEYNALTADEDPTVEGAQTLEQKQAKWIEEFAITADDFEEIPANAYDIELLAPMVSVTYDEEGNVVFTRGTNTSVLTAEDGVTDIVVIDIQNVENRWSTKEDANDDGSIDAKDKEFVAKIVNTAPEVAWVDHKDVKSRFLEDGTIVFLINYSHTDK
ncbi:MAG: dockerin type I repeat-containing protein [Clostridia bacterium]|nr:dockerin type I repeat-containing protein [Clostridia bacterium]